MVPVIPTCRRIRASAATAPALNVYDIDVNGKAVAEA
jgi:hypothetical protein